MRNQEISKKISLEQMKIFKNCKTTEELIAAAKEQGFELTPEQAAEIMKVKSGELSDEKLDNVMGGALAENMKLLDTVKDLLDQR